MIELAIVLSILTLFAPVVYGAVRGWEEQHDLATWHLRSAGELADIAEELRLDARLGEPVAGDVAFSRADCVARYVVRERTLVREGCGATRGIARDVEAVAWARGGVEVALARRLRPDREVRVVTLIPTESP